MKMVSWIAALGLVGSALATAAYAAEPVKIGIDTALSGSYAPIGQQMIWGMQLAANEINAAGGVLGRPIKLISEDAEGQAPVAVQKADKLFQVDKVDFLTGTINSGATLAVGQLAERAHKLVATAISLADSITGSKCSPNVFRVNTAASQQSGGLAAWVVKQIPHPKVYFIGPDYEMGRSTVAAFRKAVVARGGTSVGEFFAPEGSQDYTQYFGQVRAAQPQVFYVSMGGNDTVRLMTQMQEFGLLQHVQVVGNAGTITSGNIAAIGSAADGFATAGGYSASIDVPENVQFVKAFRAAYKVDPDLYAVNGYSLIQFYKAAAEKAGSIDTDKLRKAMEGLSWNMPLGQETMRAGDHQGIVDVYVVRIEGGKFKIVGKVPGDQAIPPDSCTRF